MSHTALEGLSLLSTRRLERLQLSPALVQIGLSHSSAWGTSASTALRDSASSWKIRSIAAMSAYGVSFSRIARSLEFVS
jgi:hypothetical protein